MATLIGPDAVASWDPTLPLAINIARLTSGNQTFMPADYPSEKIRRESARNASHIDLEGTFDHRLSDRNIVESSRAVPVGEIPNNREPAEKREGIEEERWRLDDSTQLSFRQKVIPVVKVRDPTTVQQVDESVSIEPIQESNKKKKRRNRKGKGKGKGGQIGDQKSDVSGGMDQREQNAMKSDKLPSKERNIFQDPELSEAFADSHVSANIQHKTEAFQRTASLAIQRVIVSLQTIDEHRSPLQLLRASIATFFLEGPQIASFIFRQLQVAALATTLVLLFACRHNEVFEALKYQSGQLGGLPTLSLIRNTPSFSFAQAFAKAKKAALSGKMATTVIGVSLTDVHIFELNVRGKAKPYTSFAHSFVVGIGPEGVVIWQSWGEYGYRLDEYLNRDGARLRNWDEAEEFVRDFNRLVFRKSLWNYEKNKYYQKCFEVDVNKVCGPNGPQRPIVPKFEAWVRLHVIENVKVEDIKFFTFE
ncbi:hypothetical protein V502_07649 [Pseudogymnoascus sp. VKM F-4520 (FW-2644)]|nr:hypothetical protein V502_07649 [Pseudogymnoascus sp. VKM F-4520 (FW-2644)]